MLIAGLRLVALVGVLVTTAVASGIEVGRGTADAEEPSTDTVTTELQPGWNLAGWTEDETEVSRIFEAIPQLDAVYTWDAFRHRFSGAFRTEFGEANRLTTLTPGMGLFLHLGGTEAVEWTRPLNTSSGATTLRPGWNLVAWAGPDGIAADEALEVLGNVVVEAQGIDSDALTTLRTGSAFWLRASSLKEWWQLDTPPIAIFGFSVPKHRRGPLTREVDSVVTYFGRQLGVGVSDLRIRFGHDYAACSEYVNRTVFLNGVCLDSLAYEYVHALQDELGRRNGRRNNEPDWLAVGAAAYWSERYDTWRTFQSYESRLRRTVIPVARETTLPLERFRNEGSVRTPRTHALSHLAVDWLVNHAGEEALFDFYAQERPSAWPSRFKAAFGLSVTEFYEAFEVHRTQAAPVTHRITGTFVDASAKPLPSIGVAIHAPDGEVVARAGGVSGPTTFDVEVPEGSYLLSFHVGTCHIGWYGRHGRINSSQAEAELVRSSPRGVDLRVQFTRLCSSIQGVIRDTDGASIAGVQAEAFSATSRRSAAKTLSDEAGSFSLDVRDGSYLLSFSRDGEPLGWFAGWTVVAPSLAVKLVPDRGDATPFVVDRDDLGDVLRAIGLEVLLPATRIAIDGTIYDSAGNPVPGAQVSAHSVDGKGLAFGTSDSDGTFTLEARQDAYVLGVRVETCERRWYHDTEGTTPWLEDATVIDPAGDSTTGIEIRLPEPPADGSQCPAGM